VQTKWYLSDNNTQINAYKQKHITTALQHRQAHKTRLSVWHVSKSEFLIPNFYNKISITKVRGSCYVGFLMFSSFVKGRTPLDQASGNTSA
jgi:hypothetical protein